MVLGPAPGTAPIASEKTRTMRFTEIQPPDDYYGRRPHIVVRVDAEPDEALLGKDYNHITIVLRPSTPQRFVALDLGTEYAIFLPMDRFSANEASFVGEFKGSIGHAVDEIGRCVLQDWQTRFESSFGADEQPLGGRPRLSNWPGSPARSWTDRRER